MSGGGGASFFRSSIKSRLCLSVSMTTSLLQYSAVGRSLHVKAVSQRRLGPIAGDSSDWALILLFLLLLPLLFFIFFFFFFSSYPFSSSSSPPPCSPSPLPSASPSFAPSSSSCPSSSASVSVFFQQQLFIFSGFSPLHSHAILHVNGGAALLTGSSVKPPPRGELAVVKYLGRRVAGQKLAREER